MGELSVVSFLLIFIYEFYYMWNFFVIKYGKVWGMMGKVLDKYVVVFNEDLYYNVKYLS